MRTNQLLTLVFTLLISVPLFSQAPKSETGIASFYHDKFIGRKTANGEIYSQEKFTAAHKTLPLGTWVRVTNLSNDSVVIVRINDRMPLWNNRSIDLTEAAARKLNYINSGVTRVRIDIISAPSVVYQTRPAELPEQTIPIVKMTKFPSAVQPTLSPIYALIDFEVYTMNLTGKKRSGK